MPLKYFNWFKNTYIFKRNVSFIADPVNIIILKYHYKKFVHKRCKNRDCYYIEVL